MKYFLIGAVLGLICVPKFGYLRGILAAFAMGVAIMYLLDYHVPQDK